MLWCTEYEANFAKEMEKWGEKRVCYKETKKLVGVSGWLIYGDSSVSSSTFKIFSKMKEVFLSQEEKNHLKYWGERANWISQFINSFNWEIT